MLAREAFLVEPELIASHPCGVNSKVTALAMQLNCFPTQSLFPFP